MALAKEYTREHLEKNVVGKIKGIAIPMNVEISNGARILELNELKRIVNSSSRLAQTTCNCRETMDNCANPRDGCIALDEYAEDWIAKGRGKELSKDAAMEAFTRSAEHGLIHVAYVRDRRKADIVCSCCPCCCDSLNAMMKFGFSDQIVSSKMISTQDESSCIDCGKCAERCHFHARTMVEGKLRYDTAKCAGCGACVIACPASAIAMAERSSGGSSVPFP